MIVDLERFIAAEEPHWIALEDLVNRAEAEPGRALSMDDALRFHYLYQRIASDLANLDAFPNEPHIRQRLETLVARAYAEIHETRHFAGRFKSFAWFFGVFPRTVRRHWQALVLVSVITLIGALFGAFLAAVDSDAKRALIPFSGLHGNPADRVAQEEAAPKENLDYAGTFSAMLMTNNIRVSIFAMVLGITWGIGVFIVIFFNGVILGLVAYDYIMAGQSVFLAGWLLPHGSIEIPSILIAGQAGLVLGHALIGWGDASPLRVRFQAVRDDLMTLILGVALLLIWAGIIESFFSQFHAPVIPYYIKITFGLVEFFLLTCFLAFSGKVSKHA